MGSFLTPVLVIGTFGKEPKKLPKVINFYNKTKVGVDCADQMIEAFSTKFSTRRWPVVLFCNLLDIAALNAYVLHEKLKVNKVPVGKRRLFIKELGKGLCQELQERRRSDATHIGLIRARLLDDTQEPPKKRGRCQICPRQTDRQKSHGCVKGMPQECVPCPLSDLLPDMSICRLMKYFPRVIAVFYVYSSLILLY